MTNPIARFADKHALWISIVAVIGYFAYFVIPGLMSSNSFGRGETHSDMGSMASQFGSEIVLAGSVLVLIVLLGWSRQARVTTPIRKGSLWWTIPPILFMALLFAVAVVTAGQLPEGAFPSLAGIATLLATVALIGLFEELLFRGVLFRGIESVSGPVIALVLSSVAFGLMHYVNWVGGQPFGATTVQVIHAGLAGFLYGALMLMTGSIWPAVILHASWDGLVSVISTIQSAVPPELNTEPSAVSAVDNVAPTAGSGFDPAAFLLAGFEPIYGLIVLLAWLRLRRRHGAQSATR